MTNLTDVLVPTSAQDAADAFGDGDGIIVVGGGTIVMPDITFGHLQPRRTLYLGRAGLDGIARTNGTYRIGAATRVAALVDGAPEPLASFAAHVGDYEVRGQATVGGNLCAPAAETISRGDLQAPLLALGARVRSVGAGGARTDSIDDFLAAGASGRLVLELEVDEPRRAATAHVRRPHAHAYTVLAVAAAETADGVRIGVMGGTGAVRATSAEQSLAGGASAEEAAQQTLTDIELRDDAVASAAYRREVLPKLVARAITDLS
jgi:aerobic carbon-monoxide dehydrogenase medium subunit